ncbi:UvrD-helicase domain-containing protein, partial [Neobacillus drentensis]|uniref:UvrD-helicase domain-containing protein n=1 Tax=Neobacillus drentensis TaxID=220684 RepID=UPI002FFE46A5
MGYFKVNLTKLLLLRHKPLLKKQLKQILKKVQEIENIIKSIKESVTLIPGERVGEIKKKYKESILTAQQKNIFGNADKVKQNIYRYPFASRPKSIIKLESDYVKRCDVYLEKFESIEGEIKAVNKKLELYYNGVEEFNVLIENQTYYISHTLFNRIKEEKAVIYAFFSANNPKLANVDQFLENFSKFDQEWVKTMNRTFVDKELKEMTEFFNNIDGKSLDEQQRRAVVTDEDGNLIVAGAGSGKTLTIAGKVKYLVEKKGVKPEEILLVSFTRKAAEEMLERIKNKLDIDVDVNTFHSLGMKVIGKEKKKRPSVEDNATQIIKGYFKDEMYDHPMQLKRMIEYFGYYLNIPIDIEKFENLGQAFHHQKNLDLQTIRSKYEEQVMAVELKEEYVQNKAEQLKHKKTTLVGETVKSLEEVMIANFLYLNGVDYVYEQDYPFQTATEQYRQYKPDFYLPEFDIYIEHFGVTKEGTVPWLSEFEERKYTQGMDWKRQTHSENGTVLIETYSYLNKDGMLLET